MQAAHPGFHFISGIDHRQDGNQVAYKAYPYYRQPEQTRYDAQRHRCPDFKSRDSRSNKDGRIQQEFIHESDSLCFFVHPDECVKLQNIKDFSVIILTLLLTSLAA